MRLDGKKILVAGGSGMAGAAVLRRLLARHSRARMRATMHTQNVSLIDDARVEWVQADLRKECDARRAATGCDLAVMCAATTAGVRGMAAAPWRAVDDNVIMNTQMLQAFHHEGVKRVVFVGSATVYQEFEGAITEEELDFNHDPHPAHLGVGWGMRFIEKLCWFWYKKTGMEILVIRAANIFGPYAVFDPERSNVIPALIRKAVSGTDPFEVWGGPDVVRDVIYVDEFAAAVDCMLSAEHIKYDTFNVGSGTGISVAQIVRCVRDAAKHKPSTVHWSDQVPGTVRHRVLDCSKAARSLNWHPVSTVAEGIRATTDWWRENQRTWTR